MKEINWKSFEIKNPNTTSAFENLCYFLFCRRYKCSEGVKTDFNQVGLETEPVKDKNGKYCGFQSKFFEKKVGYDQISNSISKALDHYDKLDHIIIYVNMEARTSCESAVEIERKCEEKGVTIEWFLPKNFLIALNKPSNIDLAELYFGETDVNKILSNSKSIRMNTLIQSKEYMKLNLNSKNIQYTIDQMGEYVLNSDEKIFLLSGDAGSGKSVCMYRLFNNYSMCNTNSLDEQKKAIEELDAVCRLFNLNNESLDSIKRTLNSDSKDLKHIVLLDGLDEISSEKFTNTLLFIERLLENDSVKKIIVSSRTSSQNRFLLKSSTPSLHEFIIRDLEAEQVLAYFEKQNNDEKKNRLNKLIKNNDSFCECVSDVLTLSLLWRYIEKVDSENSIANLMEIFVYSILSDVHHKNYIEELNLPIPKIDAIISINKALSFYLHKNKKFHFVRNELQKIIGDVFPKCDYISIDRIVSYIVENFFDINTTDNSYTFTYKHRRFSEYFYLLFVVDITKDDLCYLRRENIIINYDLFEKMYLPYLKNKAKKDKDLTLAFETGFLNMYLGNDSAWGVDKSFYIWSNWIVYAMATLPDDILQSAIEDKALPICSYFSEIPKKIIDLLSSDKDFRLYDELRQNYLNFLLLIALLHRFKKNRVLPELLSYFETIDKLCNEKKYIYNSISRRDNLLFWRCYWYIKLVVYSDDIDKNIEQMKKAFSEICINDYLLANCSEDLFCLSSYFYMLLLYYPQKCCSAVKNMTDNLLYVFAFTVSFPECLNSVFRNNALTTTLKELFDKEFNNEGLEFLTCISLKKLLENDLTAKEMQKAKRCIEKIKIDNDSIFWMQQHDVYGLIITVLKEFTQAISIGNDVKRYANAYSSFIYYICNKSSISDYVYYIKNDINNYYIRILLGKALAFSSDDSDNLKGVIDYLCDCLDDIELLIVFFMFKDFNQVSFKDMVNPSILEKMNNQKTYQDIDHYSTSDLLFMFSFISATHRSKDSLELLLKGISNGIMRMHESKESIVDKNLVESLKILLEKNWIDYDEICDYIDRIINFEKEMTKYNISNLLDEKLLEMLIAYDFNLAEYYYEKISETSKSGLIHYYISKGLVNRVKPLEDIEKCISRIPYYYDNYYHRASWDYCYYRIPIYILIASSKLYPKEIQDECFKKACSQIDALENAGWERKLRKEDYNLYKKLCVLHGKEIDVIAEENEYTKKYNLNEKSIKCELINNIHSTEDFDDVIKKIKNGILYIDSIKASECLIEKSVELTSGIDKILSLFSETHYPSMNFGTANSSNYWMITVAALKNYKSKNSMLDYLLKCNSGHDGFSELIKILSNLNEKDTCLKAFDSFMNCIDLLLC
jgi:hypothetical protein